MVELGSLGSKRLASNARDERMGLPYHDVRTLKTHRS
jgi:hypothetical protein